MFNNFLHSLCCAGIISNDIHIGFIFYELLIGEILAKLAPASAEVVVYASEIVLATDLLSE